MDGAAKYKLEVSQFPTFSPTYESITTANTRYTPTKTYATSKTYYWRVAIIDYEGKVGPFVGSTIILSPNDAPKFTSHPITRATQDVLYSYAITTNDLDTAQSLTITAPTLPIWLTLVDNGDGTATLSGIPSNAEIGSHPVRLVVTDTFNAYDTQEFNIVVNDPTMGELKINKVFDPLNLGFVGNFMINYNCDDGTVHDGTVSLATGGTTTITGIPTGTVCIVTEPALPNAPTGWNFWTPKFSPWTGMVTIGQDLSQVTVTNKISQEPELTDYIFLPLILR